MKTNADNLPVTIEFERVLSSWGIKERARVFNMVPGVEAVPIIAGFPEKLTGDVVCTIRVEAS